MKQVSQKIPKMKEVKINKMKKTILKRKKTKTMKQIRNQKRKKKLITNKLQCNKIMITRKKGLKMPRKTRITMRRKIETGSL